MEYSPTLSPDGRWLANESTETGRPEIYVVPFPNGSDGRWQISKDGGREPAWSSNGRQLFYRNGVLDMVAVDVSTGPAFSMGSSTVLFPTRDFRFHNVRQFAVSPRDGRFLMIRDVNTTDTRNLVVVLAFDEELKERAGVGK